MSENAKNPGEMTGKELEDWLMVHDCGPARDIEAYMAMQWACVGVTKDTILPAVDVARIKRLFGA